MDGRYHGAAGTSIRLSTESNAVVELVEQLVFQLYFAGCESRDGPALRSIQKTAAQDIGTKPPESGVQVRCEWSGAFPCLVLALGPEARVFLTTRPMVSAIAE